MAGESWGFSGGGVAGGEVTPGSGSSGFTSRAMVYGDSVGRLTNNSSAPVWDSTANTLIFNNSTGPKIDLRLGSSFFLTAESGTPNVRVITPATGSFGVQLGAVTPQLQVTSNGRVQIGNNITTYLLALPSTVNVSTAVGAAGAAAALPVTPENYIKIVAPNAAGTQTTMYVPAYNSTA